MTPKAKKWAVVALAIAVLGGIAYKVFWKKKPGDEKLPETGPAPDASLDPK